MKLVIDSSIIIDKLRGGKQTDRFFTTVEKQAELFLPTVVIFEIYSGLSTKNEGVDKTIRLMFAYFQTIDLTEKIARQAGEFFRDAKERVSLADFVIAATALDMGAEVVTLNIKHFSKIPGVRIYEFENKQ